MYIRRTAPALIAAFTLCLFLQTADAAPRRRSVAPANLHLLSSFLIRADRAVLTLIDGSTLEGKIEAVTIDQIAIRVKGKRSSGPSYMETVTTNGVRELFVRHVRGAAAEQARKVGFALGAVVGAPVASRAALQGSGTGMWAAIIGFPVLGAITGDRLARRKQDTVIAVEPSTDTPVGDVREP